jgi:hypothetical protein
MVYQAEQAPKNAGQKSALGQHPIEIFLGIISARLDAPEGANDGAEDDDIYNRNGEQKRCG